MIDWETYEKLVIEHLSRKISSSDNPDQHQAISAPTDQSQFLVAGPGSGKTTVMVLKILKFIYVDDVHPSSILATTFTRKAASELRSRILSWGDEIRQVLLKDPEFIEVHTYLRRLDFNQIITGTLDSISEDVLRTHRDPGASPPVVIEEFVASGLMLRIGLFDGDKHHNDDLKDYLKKLRGTAYGLNTPEMARNLLEIKDRLYYDQVYWNQLLEYKDHPGFLLALESVACYTQYLKDHMLHDFASLEAEFLDQLEKDKLDKFTSQLKMVLVDEYQDTNLLQEKIYFQLAKHALNNNGSITVVGDDDQSLYRFRGATVDLFTLHQERIHDQLNLTPQLIYLKSNYRSTENIVKFCNQFCQLDPLFQPARVKGKPLIEPKRENDYIDFPVLGLFRDDVPTLACDLSDFIQKVLNEGYTFSHNGDDYTIQADHEKGSPADLSILMSSPLELSSSGKPRLPLLLRKYLEKRDLKVFNPRGSDLERTWQTRLLCGLILECIDPECRVQSTIEKLPHQAKHNFNQWRETAQKYLKENPEPNKPLSLDEFVTAWQTRTPIGRSKWKQDVPLIELTYQLVTWIPQLKDDVESLVYLEAVTRTIAQTGIFNSFGGEILHHDDDELNNSSVREAIWNILVPIATGAIEIDEGLLETLPDDRINIMSIHQAKGLEFPLVIVDVGSDFNKNYTAQEFKRFPREGGKPCNMEDEIRTCSPLDEPGRTSRDRAFDDLTRQYFVAYSRPQDVLLLVGLNSLKDGYETKQGPRRISNVATGWSRDGKWHWKGLDNLMMI
ncbi:ATP-dependent helicase [uncultured Methanobacterium sp.]|uniref:ATP-dependent helicase n=1 Tax=uncultured Methanobacterium sp. TaxID=176306 RepID=UPI002AA7E7FC|nr:ATP-dependent helicase [uncultured Methanobacterium sp.]